MDTVIRFGTRTRPALVGALAAVGLALTGCGTPQTPDPWQQAAQDAATRVHTSLGTVALADAVVSRPEYESAIKAVEECARERGVSLVPEDRYGVYVWSSDRPDAVDVSNDCQAGDLGIVISMYEGRYKDPNMEGSDVFVRCLETIEGASRAPRPHTFASLLDWLLDNSSPQESESVDRCLYDPTGRSLHES